VKKSTPLFYFCPVGGGKGYSVYLSADRSPFEEFFFSCRQRIQTSAEPPIQPLQNQAGWILPNLSCPFFLKKRPLGAPVSFWTPIQEKSRHFPLPLCLSLLLPLYQGRPFREKDPPLRLYLTGKGSRGHFFKPPHNRQGESFRQQPPPPPLFKESTIDPHKRVPSPPRVQCPSKQLPYLGLHFRGGKVKPPLEIPPPSDPQGSTRPLFPQTGGVPLAECNRGNEVPLAKKTPPSSKRADGNKGPIFFFFSSNTSPPLPWNENNE